MISNFYEYDREKMGNYLVAKEQDGKIITKYHRKVFFKGLWSQFPQLYEARGHVFDAETGNILVRPFDKIHNHNEKGAPQLVGNKIYRVQKKRNGFMAAVTKIDGELVVSTTGSLRSPYVDLARECLRAWTNFKPHLYYENTTYLFEICTKKDPHIIDEPEGCYLLNTRHVKYGTYEFHKPPISLVAKSIGAHFDELVWEYGSEIMRVAMNCLHEGYVIYDAHVNKPITKIKSPYYLQSKFLARTTPKKIDLLWNHPQLIHDHLGEEFVPLVQHLSNKFTAESFSLMNEQERLKTVKQSLEELRHHGELHGEQS